MTNDVKIKQSIKLAQNYLLAVLSKEARHPGAGLIVKAAVVANGNGYWNAGDTWLLLDSSGFTDLISYHCDNSNTTHYKDNFIIVGSLPKQWLENRLHNDTYYKLGCPKHAENIRRRGKSCPDLY